LVRASLGNFILRYSNIFVSEKRQFDFSALLNGAGAGAEAGGLGSLLGGQAPNLGALGSLFGGQKLGGASSGGLAGLMSGFNKFKDMATGFISSGMKSITLRPESIQRIKSELKEEARRVKIKYGPFKIKGRNSTVSWTCPPYLSACF
jgi:hypothetical protein